MATEEEPQQPLQRSLKMAIHGDEDTLGPLCNLPGTWSNKGAFAGRGWNLIALPFAGGRFNYRLLMNQYNEELKFTTVDTKVPNRGISGAPPNTAEADQKLVALDYEQRIDQLKAEDFPASGEAGGPCATIHHEPGLWLHMKNHPTDGIDIARLATIPHGDSVLALGRSTEKPGIPNNVSALPPGIPTRVPDPADPAKTIPNPYLDPYNHFINSPFKGIQGPSFPGFNPDDTTALLKAGAPAPEDIVTTHVLVVDTELNSGGIVNIPFIVKQANAASMKSTFWIHELKEQNEDGTPVFILQYLQVVMLDFFPRRDGLPGLIGWPHISINTMIHTPHSEEMEFPSLCKIEDTADSQACSAG